MIPAAAAAALERVNAFQVNNTTLFKHYFDGDDVFARLRPYYDGRRYRFYVLVGEFDSLRWFLRGHGEDVSIVDRPETSYVAVRQNSELPEAIFGTSVHPASANGYSHFLVTDRRAVEDAVGEGAILLGRRSRSVPRSVVDFGALAK